MQAIDEAVKITVTNLEASAKKADEHAAFWKGKADELHNQAAVLRDLHAAGTLACSRPVGLVGRS